MAESELLIALSCVFYTKTSSTSNSFLLEKTFSPFSTSDTEALLVY